MPPTKPIPALPTLPTVLQHSGITSHTSHKNTVRNLWITIFCRRFNRHGIRYKQVNVVLHPTHIEKYLVFASFMSKKSVAMKGECSKDDESEFSWTEDGKSLSKNLLYTPMVAYQKALENSKDVFSSSSASASARDDYHPSQYMNNRSSVPKSLQEPSLVSLLHSISCDYHRKRAGVSEAKNNGSRPMSLSDAEEKTRQRAITLLGGGINASIATNKKQVRPKKRRHRSWEEKKDCIRKFASSSSSSTLATESDDVASFLRKLNAAWNEYVRKILLGDGGATTGGQTPADLSLPEIEGRLLSLASRTAIDAKNASPESAVCGASHAAFEMIGAHVRIETCHAHRSWTGRFGVLVGETTNTYRIAGLSRRKTKRTRKKTKRKSNQVPDLETENEHDGGDDVEPLNSGVPACDSMQEETQTEKIDSTDVGAKAPFVEVFLLPKRGSSFQLIIPSPLVQRNEAKDDDNNPTNTVDGDDGNTFESIIAIPEEAIAISIIDPSQQAV